MAFTHPSSPLSVYLVQCPYLKKLSKKRSSSPIESTYQSSGPVGSTYQSSALEGYTYQSSTPEGYTTWDDPVGHRACRVRYLIDKANSYSLNSVSTVYNTHITI
ncbi:NBS-LRR type resistance protein [Cucumis melo var. makuwa]|uniref:NBS-LRR type resistance protein n=1 Tax=Cucumis melo var. makuwa TaxID=1194695 RepID=A0A5D3D5U3_CUCMM|nr:NBS-LRR type resistance protein [Cucumis melo var. makuwa]